MVDSISDLKKRLDNEIKELQRQKAQIEEIEKCNSLNDKLVACFSSVDIMENFRSILGSYLPSLSVDLKKMSYDNGLYGNPGYFTVNVDLKYEE